MTTRKNKRWDEASIREAARGCKTRQEFYTKERQAYAAAIRQDLLEDVCTDMTPITRWNAKTVATEAKKYKTRSEFADGTPGAYNYAARKQLLDVVCTHMPTNMNKKNRKWTNDALREAAKSYDTRADFRAGNRSAYVTAHREGIIDELFPPVR